MTRSLKPVKHVRAGWVEVVLVCRKCSKKLDGGFGPDGKQRFATSLRKILASSDTDGSKKRIKGRRGRIGIVEVDCLDVCPKGAVVAMRAGSPSDWLIIPEGRAMRDIVHDLQLQSLIDMPVVRREKSHSTHAREVDQSAAPGPQSVPMASLEPAGQLAAPSLRSS